ncbi:hypothetical protein [Brumimicrobium aurantiacum]|uniref:Uncharacterized protein n=1 Tax=Brumimicrobium aurantiacum TaxID=1737063 RepID=A0A3E1F0H3_9FLAO|nr:hypothetical protein [Brumimicrobium aurantiacum]RFC55223.1 hypothetical protein DXU93_05220 [Brumimicrobium aurantiacum]
MRWSYFFKHWFTTVVLGTILCSLVLFNDIHIFWLMFGVFYVTLFSFPTFTLLAFIFQYLDKIAVETKKVKAILILSTISGVVLSELVIVQNITLEITLSYSLAAIISGMIFKLKSKEIENIS